MFDQCLKILLIFGSFSAGARGEDEYTTTSTSTIAGNYNGKLSCPYVLFEPASHECYAGDPNCEWKNDPSADQAWVLDPSSVGVIQRNSYVFDGLIYRDEPSPRGNSSIRMISPMFRRDSNYSCVTFGFKLNTYSKSGFVGLRVYQKPVHIPLTDLMAYSDEAKKDYTIFEGWGGHGDYWYTKEFPLKHFDSNFQIILEGIFGKDRMDIKIGYIALKRRTECTGQTTSTTISTTTTMSTTTKRPMRENGDTITDKVTISDTWVDSRTASPLSNLWPTLPTTKQSTTTKTLQEGNARGEDEYTTTSTSTIAGNYNGKLSCPYVLFEPASHECYAGDPKCDWKNDPSADQAWNLHHYYDDQFWYSYIFDGLIYRDEPSPRGNSSIRMISPIFRRDSNYSCVTFGFRLNTYSKSGLVGLRVYQKPVHIALTDLMAFNDEAKKDYIIFEAWGDHGDYWCIKKFPLKHFDSNFQIILEGIFGKDRMDIKIGYISLKRRTECRGQTTSTTISTTTTMSTTTTERPMRENGDTISDKVTITDTWVHSRSASPITNLWPTLPTTKQSTTTQTLQEGNARGEDEYTTTSTSTIAGNYNECYAGDPNCEWKNDPSANLTWLLDPSSVGVIQRNSYIFDGLIYRDEPSPRGNSSIRMISPIFRRDSNYSCVTFGFRLNTYSKSGFVGLRVYQKPVHIALTDLIAYSDDAKKDYTIFEGWGGHGDYWYTKEFPLKHFDSNFQIILEGIFGKDRMDIKIGYIALKRRTECTGQTTSTTISTTTTMSTTTTERPMRENGDTITDKVTISDLGVDSRSASPLSKLWPTSPTTKQSTTTQTLQEGNGGDSRNPPIIL